jgi:hypothetical protein
MTRGQRHYARNRQSCLDRSRQYRLRNLEAAKAASRAYTSRPDIKEKRRLRTYGLTLESYQVLLTSQNNACAICLTPFANLRKLHIHIDHDHLLEKVRGILCHNCNLGVGHFKDEPKLLKAAAIYLLRI